MVKRAKTVRQYQRENLLATMIVFVLFALCVIAIITSHTFQLGGELVAHVKTDEKLVALTFDDGPTSDHTATILQTLRDKDVTATFYVIGLEVTRHPAALQQIVASGHELGNHSFYHSSLVFKSKKYMANGTERTDRLIRDAGYGGDITVRPPYGHKFVNFPQYLAANNRTTVMWDVAPDDNGAVSAEKIVEETIDQVEPGSIMLLHTMYDHNEPSRQALPIIIDRLKADGYRFVTVSELLNYR